MVTKSRGGGWDHGSRAKSPSELDIRFGNGLLKQESASWPRYLVVSTPAAYKTARCHLAREPRGIAPMSRGVCDFGHLQALADSLPDDVDLVIGLGGGSAMDGSKYVALAKGLPLILVPTVVSTAAIVHGVFGRWEGRNLIGGLDDWPWVDIDHVIVDYDVTLAGPWFLNTAALGDVLCGYAGIAEWRRNSKRGTGPRWEEKVTASMVEQYTRLAREFPRTLDGNGNLTAKSIHFIVEAIKERDEKTVRHPAYVAGEHYFLHCLELVNDRSWIHGEVVALGAVIIAWHCDEAPGTLVSWLDTCKVRQRPDEMQMSRAELLKGLESVPAYFAERDIDSVIRREPISGSRFEALWQFLERTK